MTSINDVLAQLEQIVAECTASSSPMGYFPALYHAMTKAVQAGIRSGQFEDGARIERLDILFAQRYLDAYAARSAGLPTTRSWQAAFDAASNSDLTVLQHLLLGIHAHINLDLGIAAAQTCPGTAIWGLERDFNAINAVISDLTAKVQLNLSGICPPMGFLDNVLRTQDEGIADFSILVARKTAWNAAVCLAFLEGGQRQVFIDDVDLGVAEFAQRLCSPKGWVLRSALNVVRVSELGDVSDRIRHVMLVDRADI